MELKHPDVEDVKRTKISPEIITLFFIQSLDRHYKSYGIVQNPINRTRTIFSNPRIPSVVIMPIRHTWVALM